MEIAGYVLISLFSGGIVFVTSYFAIKSFLQQADKRRMDEYKMQNQKTILPIRLQAYERIVLFLERISPESLLMRLQVPGMKSLQLQKEILSLVRAEFEHNLSQQIYMSAEAWEVARSAKENIIKIIHTAADGVNPDAPAIELSKAILEKVMQVNPLPTKIAIDFIKKEISQFY